MAALSRCSRAFSTAADKHNFRVLVLGGGSFITLSVLNLNSFHKEPLGCPLQIKSTTVSKRQGNHSTKAMLQLLTLLNTITIRLSIISPLSSTLLTALQPGWYSSSTFLNMRDLLSIIKDHGRRWTPGKI